MILPRNELTSQPQIVEFSCSSETPAAAVCSSSSSSSDEEEHKELIYSACDLEETEIVLSSPSRLYPIKSCLKQSTRRPRSSWSGNSSFFLHNEDSVSSFRSSFSSQESSSTSTMALTTIDCLETPQRPAGVTFDERVREKLFVPDWADPRVISYERKQAFDTKRAGSPAPMEEHSELRRLDHCYVQVLLKQQLRHPKGNSTATKQKNPFTDSTVWCPRGLEVHWDPTIGARKRQVRLQSTCHILHTQALQRQRADNENDEEIRIDDDQEMADAYRPYSEPCQTEAHRQGLLDELDAHCDVGHGVLQVLQEHRRSRSADSTSDEDTAAAAADDASSVTSSSCSSRSSACSIGIAMVRRSKGRRSERFSRLLEEPESLSSSNSYPTH